MAAVRVVPVLVVLATLTAALLVPATKRVAHALGAVDRPGGRRVHARITPRMGGLAVLGAFIASLGIAVAMGMFPWDVHAHSPVGLATILGGGCLLALVGAADDVRDLGAKKKLAAQIAAATIAYWGGARIESIDLPGLAPIQLGPVLGYGASVVWVLAFINAINLIDGLDGLAGGVCFFACLTNTVVALISNNPLAAALNGALGGAILGFLFYNFNPATIFLGDTGSMFLGYALGCSALLTGRQKESTIVSLLVPVIALGLPLADTLFTMVRRFLARRPIFSADRGHIHHRLLDLGLTHRRAVLILYACSVLLCTAAVGAAFGKNWQVGAALLGAVLTLVGVARFAGYFEFEMLQRSQREHLLSGPTERLRRLLPALVIASNEADTTTSVWASFEALLEAGPFAYAELSQGNEAAPSWRWQSSERSGQREGKLIECEFSMRLIAGSSAGVLRLGFLSDESALAPHVEVLLQLVVDAVEAGLVRVHSRAPRTMMRAIEGGQTAG